MTRYSDWTVRLQAFLRDNATRPFQYGDFDCALFVSSAVLTMTGVDPAAPWRGTYSTRAEARAIISAAGGFEAIAASNGMPEVPVTFAQRGDVVAVRPFGIGLVAFNGRDVLVLAENGLTKTPLSGCVRAWRV